MKKIIFVIDSLHCAGAEKSLITLLSLLDYSKYEVDLQLFGYGGALEKLLPKEVNLLKPLKYTSFCELSIKSAFKYSIKRFNTKMISARLKFTVSIRKAKYSNVQKARIFWQKVSSVIEDNEKKYDIAISYAQGVPTFYVADKIKARKKYAWVNTSYRLEEEEIKFVKKYYDEYQEIIAVSHSAKDIFLKSFPEYFNKVNEEIDDNGYIKILTIGRLAYGKRYDRAIEASKILKNKGIKFKWYVLGIGPLEDELKKSIKDNNLKDNFILLGVKINPYPYIKKCDIYVQTSDFEGFGLAIAEARMLNKPVVTTRFDSVYNQMIDRKNGLVVDLNARSVSDGILELINNEKLKNEIVDYLAREKKGNIEELDKFYELIG